jgi:hypothetical protein
MNHFHAGLLRGVAGLLLVLCLSLVPLAALASSVDTAVVDTTAPMGSVTLAPGGSASITINLSVTGRQDGTATFKVNRDWTLSGGTFTGSNPLTFTVGPRVAGDPATTFSTSGTVTVAASQAAGVFTLAIGAFDITNTNSTGAKLSAGASSSYEVTVVPPADTTPPTITVTSPTDNGVYLLNQPVKAGYSCEDTGSGVAQCEGTVANGASIDTGSVGTHTFTVNAKDNAGNTSTKSVTYIVTCGIKLLYDPTKAAKAGSTIPIKIQLVDANGTNVSSSAMTVKAIGITKSGEDSSGDTLEDSGNANPDSNFRYDPTLQGYIYNLSTKGLSTGTYTVTITINGVAPSPAGSVQFGVK